MIFNVIVATALYTKSSYSQEYIKWTFTEYCPSYIHYRFYLVLITCCAILTNSSFDILESDAKKE
jgi:hypothetical protein